MREMISVLFVTQISCNLAAFGDHSMNASACAARPRNPLRKRRAIAQATQSSPRNRVARDVACRLEQPLLDILQEHERRSSLVFSSVRQRTPLVRSIRCAE